MFFSSFGSTQAVLASAAGNSSGALRLGLGMPMPQQRKPFAGPTTSTLCGGSGLAGFFLLDALSGGILASAVTGGSGEGVLEVSGTGGGVWEYCLSSALARRFSHSDETKKGEAVAAAAGVGRCKCLRVVRLKGMLKKACCLLFDR